MFSIMIVDDEYPARQMMRMMIDALPDYAVAAEAENGRQALELYQTRRPDIIVTDIEMPVMNGLELIEAVKAQDPGQPIIILSCYESFVYAQRAMRSGVRSYLIKDMTGIDDMLRCLNDAVGQSRPEVGVEAPDDAPLSSDTFEKLRRVQPIGAADMEAHLDALFTSFFKHEDACIAEVRRLYRLNLSGMLQYRFLQFVNTTLVGWIAMEMGFLKAPADLVFGDSRTPEDQLEACASPAEMCSRLCDWLSAWFRVYTDDKLLPDRSAGVLGYIVDHYQEDFSLENLARQFYLHPVYLSRSYKSDTGTTLTASVNLLRIEKAKLLLAVGNRKVSDIAFMVGFGSTQGFYNAFKKYTGLSPAQYSDSV